MFLLRERELAMTYPVCEQSYPYDTAPSQPQLVRRPAAWQVIGSPYVWDGGGRAEGESSSAQSWRIAPGLAGQPTVRSLERAVIGDKLREVVAWCELGQCIARYVKPGALGHADIAACALAAGWCKDAVGRLICPSCQQRFPIWSSAPVAPRTQPAACQLGSPHRYVGQHRARAAKGRADRLGGGIRADSD